jgi:hypothetical protein
MRVFGGRLIIEVHLRRLFVGLAVVAAIGALVGAWTVLRNNGLLGGLDHDGPLDAVFGNEAGLRCVTKDAEVAIDNLKNLSDSAITVDRVRVNAPESEIGLVVSEPRVYSVVPAPAITRVSKHAEPPRRPARGAVIPAHGVSGVSYTARYSGKFGGFPLQEGSGVTFTIRGETVDYHVGARHFRENNGTLVTMSCRGTKQRHESVPRNLPGQT